MGEGGGSGELDLIHQNIFFKTSLRCGLCFLLAPILTFIMEGRKTMKGKGWLI